jgi:hypothetical protein
LCLLSGGCRSWVAAETKGHAGEMQKWGGVKVLYGACSL